MEAIKPTVIKITDQNPHLIRRLETVNVADHLGEARLVLRKSREESREILRQARIEGEQALEAASAKGFKSGFGRGYEAGRKTGFEAAFKEAKADFAQKQSQLVETFKRAIEQFDAQKRDLFISASSDMLDFAMQVARRVTHRIGVVDREAARENLQAALRLVERQTELTVYVNPVDANSIKDFAEDAEDVLAGAKHFQIEEDEELAPGGCRLVTPATDIDASIETQLSQIEALVTGGTAESSA